MLELLAKHYGTKLADSDMPASAKNDLDSSSFDADSYTKDLLTTKTLPELISFQELLSRKTRSLDSGMQNLVYENYNKFISATETIRTMRDSVGKLDSEMDELRKMIEVTGATSSALNTALEGNRQRIEQLVGVRRLIGKLEFLFELPARLRSCIDLGAPAQAVSYYRAASRVLKAYADVGSLRTIAAEADIIAAQLRDSLRVALDDASSRVGVVMENTQLLLLLNDDPTDVLGRFLKWHKRRLETLLRAAVDSARRVAGKSPRKAVLGLNTMFLDVFVHTARTFRKLMRIAETVRRGTTGRSAAARRRRQRAGTGMRADEDDVDLDDDDDDVADDDDKRVARRRGAKAAHDDSDDGSGDDDDDDDQGDDDEDGKDDGRTSATAALEDELTAFGKDMFAKYFASVRSSLGSLSVIAQVKREVARMRAEAEGEDPDEVVVAGDDDDDDRDDEGEAEAARPTAEPNDHSERSDDGHDAGDEDDNDEDGSDGNGSHDDVADSARRVRAAQPPKPRQHKSLGDKLGAALNLMLVAVRSADRLVSHARLRDRSAETAEAALRETIDRIFNSVHEEAALLIGKCLAEATDAANRAAAAAAAAAVSASGSASASAVSSTPTAELSPDAVARYEDGISETSISTVARKSGEAVRELGEQLCDELTTMLRGGLRVCKSVVLTGMVLLPDLARMFAHVLPGYTLSALLWLSAAAEAAADPLRCGPAALGPAPTRRPLVLVDARETLAIAAPVSSGSSSGPAGSGTGLFGFGDDEPPEPGTTWAQAPSLLTGGPISSLLNPSIMKNMSHLRRRAAIDAVFLARVAAAAEAHHDAVIKGSSASSAGAAAAEAAAAAASATAAGGTISALSPSSLPACVGATRAVVLAVFAERLASDGVSRVMDALVESQPTVREMIAAGVHAAAEDEGLAGPALDAFVPQSHEMLRRAEVAAAVLAHTAAASAGERLGRLLGRAARVARWSELEEPRGARPATVVVLREALALWHLLAGASSRGASSTDLSGGEGVTPTSRGLGGGFASRMPAPGAPRPGASTASAAAAPAAGAAGATAATGARGGPGGLEQDLDRLFGGAGGASGAPGTSGGGSTTSGAGGRGAGNSASDLLLMEAGRSLWEAVGGLPLSPGAIVGSALRLAFWDLGEALREADLGEHGFAQAQADVAALHIGASTLLHGRLWRQPVDAVLDEALASAADRAPAGAALDPSIVWMLGNEAVAAAGLRS